MYHGNLGASFSRVLGYDGPVVWNVRHSVHNLSQEKWATRSFIRLGARVSGSVSRIIYNSEAAAAQHEKLGYRAGRRVVVPNGFDVERFQPNPSARMRLRQSLGIGQDELLLGVVGRLHPMKNHEGWVRAFAKIVRSNAAVHCLMMGTGVDDPGGPVACAVKEAGLAHRIHFHAPTCSPEIIYPSMDLLVLPSSFGEGLSNVVGEAMACGVPAAVTDVGDSPVLVGETGFVIDGMQPGELAAGVDQAIRLGPKALADLGKRARQRVIDQYSLGAIGKMYYDVLTEALGEKKD
jgi:glycosyltransferase involved in cell wall biosynthesis